MFDPIKIELVDELGSVGSIFLTFYVRFSFKLKKLSLE